MLYPSKVSNFIFICIRTTWYFNVDLSHYNEFYFLFYTFLRVKNDSEISGYISVLLDTFRF